MPGRRGFLIIAAAVVVAGAGTWIGVDLTSTPAPTASTTGMAEIWHTAFPTGATMSTGYWVQGDQIVAGYDTSVTAYDLNTGRIEWSWQSPAGQQVLELSQDTENNTGVLVYSAPTKFDAPMVSWTMAAINLADGRLLWTTRHTTPDLPVGPVVLADGRISTLSPPGVSAPPRVSAKPATKLTVFDLATGVIEWTTSSTQGATQGCDMRSQAFVANDLYAEAYCGGSDTKLGAAHVFAFAPDSGALLAGPFVTSCSDDQVDSNVWSAVGHVVVGCDLLPKMWVSPAGARFLIQAGPTVDASLTGFMATNKDTAVLPGFAAFGDTLYLVPVGSGSVAAISLTDGRQLWNEPLPADYFGRTLIANRNGVDILLDNGSVVSLVRYSPTGVESRGPGFTLPTIPVGVGVPTPTIPDRDNSNVVLDGTRLVLLGGSVQNGFSEANAVTVLGAGSWTG